MRIYSFDGIVASPLIYCKKGYDDDLGEELDNIITYLRKSLDIASSKDLPRLLRLHMGRCLQSRFTARGADTDLEEGITTLRRAITLTPDGHSSLPSKLNDLADSLNSRFFRFGEDADLEEAIRVYQRGTTLTSGSTRSKYDCATGLATLAHANVRLSVALEGYSSAISLMSQVAWSG
jgi:hypothetical protein